MPVLHLSEQGARVGRRGKSLIVVVDGREVLEVEIPRLEFVGLYGGVNMTTQALGSCLRQGVGVGLFTRTGRLKGVCRPARPRNADLRLAQYQRHNDTKRRLKTARAVVAAKLHNAACLLGDLAANHPEWELLKERDRVLKTVERVKDAENAETLLGIEGAGAAAYFAALRRAFPKDAGFQGRKSYPSTDPANALLSFSYSLLAAELTACLEARGLDACLGIYHKQRSGFASLAYDFLELFRHPFCDRVALTCFNQRRIKAEDFEPAPPTEDSVGRPKQSGGLRMKREALKRFLAGYEKTALRGQPRTGSAGNVSVRELFRNEIEAYIRDLRGTEEYRPLRWREKA